MLNVSEKLLNISRSIKKDEFDDVKNIFRQMIRGVSDIYLDDSEFVLDKSVFKIRTLGVKKVRISMFVEDIQEKMKSDLTLSNFSFRL
ncbi:MAG: hypothetical protein RJB39_479 [Candidatus Parcubacteria bacterium]|jgi:hypothetical protein